MKRSGNPLRPSFASKQPQGNPLYDGRTTSSAVRETSSSYQLPAASQSRAGNRRADTYRPPPGNTGSHPLPARPPQGTGANQTPLGSGSANSGFNIRGASTSTSARAGNHARMTANNIANGYYGSYTAPGGYYPPSGYSAPTPYVGGLQGNWYH